MTALRRLGRALWHLARTGGMLLYGRWRAAGASDGRAARPRPPGQASAHTGPVGERHPRAVHQDAANTVVTPALLATRHVAMRQAGSAGGAAVAVLGLPQLAGQTVTEQRFTGSARPKRAPAARRERRVRLMLAALMAALLLTCVSSALVIFAPRLFHAAFGVTPGERVAAATAPATSVVAQGPPLTALTPVAPTATASAMPTATPLPAGGCGVACGPATPTPPPTATAAPTPATPVTGPGPASTPTPMPLPTATLPAPTATPLPTATVVPAPTATIAPTATALPTATPPLPTPTVPVYASAATVTFTRVVQSLPAPPATMTACDGCSVNAAAGTIPAAYVRYGANWWLYGGWSASAVSYNADPVLTIHCIVSSSGDCFIAFQTSIPNGSGSAQACQTGADLDVLQGESAPMDCVVNPSGFQTFNFGGRTVPCDGGGHCSAVVTGEDSFQGGFTLYYMPTNCLAYGNNGQAVQQVATSQALQWLASNGLPDTLAGPTTWFPQGYFCSTPSCAAVAPGATMPGNATSWWQCQEVDGWRFTWNHPDAWTIQQVRLASEVPANFELDPGHVSLCGNPSPVPGSIDVNGQRATISCPSSALVRYVWGAPQVASLQQALAGQTLAQAQATLRQTAGIDTSQAITITVSGGATNLPTAAGQITIVAQTP